MAALEGPEVDMSSALIGQASGKGSSNFLEHLRLDAILTQNPHKSKTPDPILAHCSPRAPQPLARVGLTHRISSNIIPSLIKAMTCF